MNELEGIIILVQWMERINLLLNFSLTHLKDEGNISKDIVLSFVLLVIALLQLITFFFFLVPFSLMFHWSFTENQLIIHLPIVVPLVMSMIHHRKVTISFYRIMLLHHSLCHNESISVKCFRISFCIFFFVFNGNLWCWLCNSCSFLCHPLTFTFFVILLSNLLYFALFLHEEKNLSFFFTEIFDSFSFLWFFFS